MHSCTVFWLQKVLRHNPEYPHCCLTCNHGRINGDQKKHKIDIMGMQETHVNHNSTLLKEVVFFIKRLRLVPPTPVGVGSAGSGLCPVCRSRSCWQWSVCKVWLGHAGGAQEAGSYVNSRAGEAQERPMKPDHT